MDERISTMKSNIEHARGTVVQMHQHGATELNVALKQFENKLDELQSDYLPNIEKALNG